VKKENDIEFFLYRKIMILQGFSFDRFLSTMLEGNLLVDFDARTGHNHGTKFRLREGARPSLYSSITEI
jgi:hypothetical protein